jgi:signal transduction histidine kinase/DNA-binding NarL/FixJ family response regulator
VQALRVHIVSRDAVAAEGVRETLAALGMEAVTVADALPASGGLPACDVVLVLHPARGERGLKELIESDPERSVPVVVVERDSESAHWADAVRRGAEDYLTGEALTAGLLERSLRFAVERHGRRHKLGEQSRRVRSVIEGNADGILVVEPGGRILFANPAAERLLANPTGHAAGPLVGSRFAHPLVVGELAEVELPAENGQARVAEMRADATVWDGEPAMLVALRDISQRRAVQLELLRYQRRIKALTAELSVAEHRERRRLAQVLHDDLQQTLVAAKMCVSVDVNRAAADATRVNLTRVMDLLDQAVRTSRSLTAELSPTVLYDVGLVAACEWLIKLVGERYGLQVTLDADGTIDADGLPADEDLRGFLYQAVREMLFNVVKHGQVAATRLEITRQREYLRIEVQDEGPGFTPAQLKLGWHEGEGFGLFHIQQRLERYDGTLDVESRPGSGCRMIMTVPVLDLDEPEGGEPERTAGGARFRVMLVDDHATVRQGLAVLLEREDDIDLVGEAQTGREAVEKARDLRPDVVVMDLTLPDLPGPEATRQIIADWPKTRVIGLSMHDSAEAAPAMLAAGAESYLEKGRPVQELIRAIRSPSATAPATVPATVPVVPAAAFTEPAG